MLPRNITRQSRCQGKCLQFIENIQILFAERFVALMLGRFFFLSKAPTQYVQREGKNFRELVFTLSFGVSLILVLYILTLSG